MARVFRKSYTIPVPADAVRTTMKHKGKTVPAVKINRDGKTITAPITRNGERCLVYSPTWYGTVKGEHVPLCTNKAAAEIMLAEKIRAAEMREVSPAYHLKEENDKPLAEHIDDWQRSLLASGVTEKHASQTTACVRRLVDACGFRHLLEITAGKVESFLADLRADKPTPRLDPAQAEYTREEIAALLGIGKQAITDLVRRYRLEATGNGKRRRYPRATVQALLALHCQGCSTKTSNLYLDGVRSFVRWCIQEYRLQADPLARLRAGNARADRRHDRRALSRDDLMAIITAARASTKTILGLAGPDRAMLYAVACTTGFRASELAILRPPAFEIDEDVPVIHLAPEDSKNGKGAIQPIPADLVPELRSYLEGKPRSLPLWPGPWFEEAAEMLRHDLDTAGIPYTIQAPDGRTLHADFHALRHSFIALLDRTGATLKEAMQLARHSDPRLTMAVYGRAEIHNLAGAVDRISLTQPPEQKTRRKAAN